MTKSDPSPTRDATRWGRLRWAVRAVLALGVAASVAANILHAESDPVARVIAGWPPIALGITIELISRVPVRRRGLTLVRIASTGLIASIAAWVSYWHMVSVCARYGETKTSAHLIPLTVDGLVIVGSVCLVELTGRIRAAQDAGPMSVAAPVDEQPPAPPAAPEPVTEAPAESDPESDPDGTDEAPAPGEPRPLDDVEYARVLRAVRSYRRSNPDGRPPVGWVRERAKIGQRRINAAVIDRALSDLAAREARSDPGPTETEPDADRADDEPADPPRVNGVRRDDLVRSGASA